MVESFEKLPAEIQAVVLERMNFSDIIKLCKTSRYFYNFCKDPYIVKIIKRKREEEYFNFALVFYKTYNFLFPTKDIIDHDELMKDAVHVAKIHMSKNDINLFRKNITSNSKPTFIYKGKETNVLSPVFSSLGSAKLWAKKNNIKLTGKTEYGLGKFNVYKYTKMYLSPE